MFRGITTFKCTKCGKKFKAPDIELAATVYSVPQRCPHCGSIRTRPVNIFPFNLWDDAVYKNVWNRMEERNPCGHPGQENL